jgi:hypothetical protein
MEHFLGLEIMEQFRYIVQLKPVLVIYELFLSGLKIPASCPEKTPI